MNKRLFSALSLLLFAAMLAACGGQHEDPTPLATFKLIRLDGTALDFNGSPIVAGTKPIPVSVSIETSFSQAMDHPTVESSASLVDSNGAPVAGTFSWSSNNRIMTFTPFQVLRPAAVYHFKISTGASTNISVKAQLNPVDLPFTTMMPGDVNGDGVPDLVAGASGASVAYVFSGKVLSGTKYATDAMARIAVSGESSVAIAGDVNADGYADVIIGDVNANTNLGAAYIYNGADLAKPEVVVQPVAVISGTAPNGAFGNSVAYACDIQSDGYDDVIIGAAVEGAAFIFSGNGLFGTSKSADAADVIIRATEANGFGASVACAGDVDRDGKPDMIIGAPDASVTSGGNMRGTAYLFLNPKLGGSRTTADADSLIVGLNDFDEIGSRVSSAGDVNADGMDDVIIGSGSAGGGDGAASVFSGAALTSGVLQKTVVDAVANYRGAAGESLGAWVGSAGDVNGDGRDDVIISGIGGSGTAYIYSGANLGGAPLAAMTGPGPLSGYGIAVSTIGDINADGMAEVAVGAPGAESNAGSAFIYGGTGALISTLIGDLANGLGDNLSGMAR